MNARSEYAIPASSHLGIADTAKRRPKENHDLPWTWTDLLALVLICLGVVIAIYRFWQPGVSSEADMLIGVYRVFELDQAWRNWIFFPRLGPNLNFTYGAPLFQYYSPLASYVALILHWAGLGLIEAAKAVFTLNLALAGVGAYIYARWLFGSRQAALVSGLAYLLAPYLLTVIYERGAAAEGLALGLIPWVFWALHRLLNERSRGSIAGAAVLVALLLLAHNITALFVLPVVTVYLLLLAWHEGRLKQLVGVLGAIMLGLGLSAFYWVPALGEVRFARVEGMLVGRTNVLNNLVPWRELVQPAWVFDYWGAMRFHLSLWQAVLGVLSALAIAIQPPRLRFNLILFAGVALLALILQLTASRVFWETMPLVRFIQFPWRLLGLISFCIAMLLGSVFCGKPLKGTIGTVLAVGLLALIIILGTQKLDPRLSSIWYPITNAEIGKADLFERGRFNYPLFNDYAPAAMQVDTAALARPRAAKAPVTEPLSVVPQIQVLSEKPDQLDLKIETASPFALRLHRTFFPGWQVYVDGRKVPTGPSGQIGLVTAEIPAGSHRVLVRFEDTPLRRVAVAISLVSVLILIFLVVRSPVGKAGMFVVGIGVLVLVILFVRHQGMQSPAHHPIPAVANFQDEIRLLGYDLPQTTWKPGSVIPLRLYWLAQHTPAQDYKVFIHLAPLDDSGQVAQSDRWPILDMNPPTLWEPGELVVDEQLLELPETTPSGTYRLLVGLYRPSDIQNLTVSQAANVLPGDRLVLTEIEVRND